MQSHMTLQAHVHPSMRQLGIFFSIITLDFMYNNVFINVCI